MNPENNHSNNFSEEIYREHMKGIMENVIEMENKSRLGLLLKLELNSTNPGWLLLI